MTKLWRLLMASTVLSGLAGITVAHAASDLAFPKPDNRAEASIVLAQAQPVDDTRRRNQQDQNKPAQNKQQGQNQQQGQGKQNQPQGGQNKQQQGQNQPQGQNKQQGQAKQNQPQGQNKQQGQAKQSQPQGQNKQQGQNQQQGQGRQNQQQDQSKQQGQNKQQDNQRPAANRQDDGNRNAATNDRGGQNQNKNQNKNQNQNRNANQNQNQNRNANQDQGRGGNNANQNQQGDNKDRAGNNRNRPPSQSDDKTKPIQSAGPGKGVAVKSASGQEIHKVDDLKKERRETKEGGRTVIREPGRTIIKEGNNKTIIRHDETLRFRIGATNVRVERVGNDNRTVIIRPNGDRIITVTDRNGFLLRRVRILPNGREIILINNRPLVAGTFFVVLPPPRILIPRDRYIVAYRSAPPALIYETLIAPPVEVIERPYTLEEIRYSAPVRDRMPRIDLDDITFDTGSWELAPDQINKLANIAEAMKRAIDRNPAAMFLIEGHTDAVGDDDDNLSLSDRRAESVAVALTEQFQVPAENLTTQGYGEQQLKVPTDGPEEQNRRVTVRNIAPLLAGKAEATSGESVPQ